MAVRTKPRAKSSEGWTWELTQLECQKRGWIVRRVDWRDRWGRTHDLFGCIDALAWDDQWPKTGPSPVLSTIAIQFTSAANRAARRKKMDALDLRYYLKAAGWSLRVWAWRIKDGKPVLTEDVL